MLFHIWSCTKNNIPGPLISISCTKREGLTRPESWQDKMETMRWWNAVCLLHCPLCANWGVNKDCQRLGREAWYNRLQQNTDRQHRRMQCAPSTHGQAQRGSEINKRAGGGAEWGTTKLLSFLCFVLLHSNLHVELREQLVATIAASNVLQSSACLSQGPRRLGEEDTEYHK